MFVVCRFNLAYQDYQHVLLLDTRVEQAHLGKKRYMLLLAYYSYPYFSIY